MDSLVKRRLKVQTATDPLGRAPADDPWRDFRDIELLDFPLEFKFRHSLGKLSRFFIELESQRLMATRCPQCETVWMPPRPICADDRSITEWTELGGAGTLEAASLSAYTVRTDGGGDQMVLGYVALDGASTLLLQQIRNYGDATRLVAGLRVHVVWAEAPVDHPMELFWFEPDE